MAITCGKNAYWVAKRGIVQNGLVLNLDAAVSDSYPGYGTTWRDLSGNNNGTLTNGPTFSDANGGSIVCDSIDDYVSINDILYTFSNNKITVFSWAKVTSSVSKPTSLSFGGYYNFFYPGSRISSPNFTQLYWDSSTGWKSANTFYTLNTIRCFAWTIDSNNLIFYNNGIPDGGGTVFFSPSSIGNLNRLFLANNGEYHSGNTYNIYVYNRALSQAEITQNFNATRSRFGV